MDFNKYIDSLKNIYVSLMDYIDSTDEEDENLYQKFIDTSEKHQIFQKRDSLQEFLTLINKISKYHHRLPTFFNRIDKILLYLEDIIKKTFSNIEIFIIFKNNKRVLLFLIHQEIIIIDDNVIAFVNSKSEIYSNDFYCYFYNEVKEKVPKEMKLNIESQIIKMNPNIFDKLIEKCLYGENDSYICTLIQQDSIDEFVAHATRTNISLESTINYSIFETHSFLLKKNPTLIEYATFCGSIQIFQYLRLNNVELNPSLWHYAIHSRNAEMIHLLESNHIIPDDKETYEECFIESIKCHHNEIADYIQNNLLKKFTKNCQIKIIRYYNYHYFDQIDNQNYAFFNFYKYKHYEIINVYMKTNMENIEKEINMIFNQVF